LGSTSGVVGNIIGYKQIKVGKYFMEKLYVIKIGGNVVDNPVMLTNLLTAFSKLEGQAILVHGGGKLATSLAETLGVAQTMVEGRRITDGETLKIVTMVYAGYINKNIIAQLQAMQVNAIGLSGVDGNLIKAHKRANANIDYGFVGDIDQVNQVFIQQQLANQSRLVIAPITHDGTGQLLNTNSNIIGFSTYHKFLSGEEVKYTAGTSSNLPGLINGTNYFVNVKNPLSISVHNTNQDAVVGINSVNITGYSNERHFLTSVVSKRQINSITIENPGENYQTKITTTTPQNVNIVNSTIKIPNHGYKNGELIVHYSSGSIIGGLQSNKSYYVTVIDDDTIKLSNVYADNDLEKDFLYKTKQYVDINSPGSGTLYFDYEPIKVEIRGIIGISSTSEENFGAKLQPIFRGSVDSFYVENKGSNYGTQEILNYVRNPEIIIEQGRRAQATPIISSNGSIQEIIVINQGENYESIPDVIVRSNLGSGAVLTPIIQNKKIVEIKVINGGVNYSNNDIQIDIIPRGQGFKYQTNITSWNVNLYERLTSTNRQSSDGGILVPGESQLFGLEYAHLYLSEFLRDLVYIQTDSGSTFSDLSIDSTPVKRHSPPQRLQF